MSDVVLQSKRDSQALPKAPIANPTLIVQAIVIAVLFAVLYWSACDEMRRAWMLVDSYYTHGFLVPVISLFFVWKSRDKLYSAVRTPSAGGYVWLVLGLLMHMVGDFLGFRVLSQLSMIVVLTGLSLVFLGAACTRIMAFPLAYLIFMVPIPPSLTSSIALKLKLFAAECAVQLANAVTLPMVREGSFIHFGSDQLIVGEVCGGLRSLIALLAFGALMAYMSKTSTAGKAMLLVMSPPIAVVANVVRIFTLCVVGYFWGSKTASGTVHDISGIGIFVVAFILFFALETQLRRLMPQREESTSTETPSGTQST